MFDLLLEKQKLTTSNNVFVSGFDESRGYRQLRYTNVSSSMPLFSCSPLNNFAFILFNFSGNVADMLETSLEYNILVKKWYIYSFSFSKIVRTHW